MTTTHEQWLQVKNNPVKYEAVKKQIIEIGKRKRHKRIEEERLLRQQLFFESIHGRWDELKEQLDSSSYELLCFSFGLDGHEQLSLQKIGDRQGIRKQAVQQRRDRLVKRLIILSVSTPLLH